MRYPVMDDARLSSLRSARIILIALGAACFLLGAFAPSGVAADLLAVDLTCEYRTDPPGLGEIKPRLGWKLQASDPVLRRLHQSAYQVIVSSTPEALAADRGDVWDTGKVSSAQANNIVFAGMPLVSRAAYYWKVRAWDQAGAVSAWSQPARWTMGLLAPADWSAQWIGLDAQPPTDGSILSPAQEQRLAAGTWLRADLPPAKATPLQLWLRRTLPPEAGREIRRVTLALVPDERCEIVVNGRTVATVARWDRTRPLDLTAAFREGENVVGLHLIQGDGNPPAVLGELEIEYASGEPERWPIDETWVGTARAPAADWAQPGFVAPSPDWRPQAPIAKHGTPWGSPQRATRFLPPPPYLRKSFDVGQPVRRAMIYATALGLYELHLNGTRVGSDVLTPGWTDYRHRVPYQTYDVTALVQRGANALGAILGSGWFAGTLAHLDAHHYGGLPRFRAQLEIELADGTRQVVATDQSWRANHGPILYADLYQGSAFDARRAWPDWAHADFDDSTWQGVATGLASVDAARPMEENFAVEAATIEAPRVMAKLPARQFSEPQPGTYLYDFGQNIVGWVQLRLRGRAGERVVLRHGEMLNPNGTLYTSNLRGAAATDTFILRGDGEEILAPIFTFHGFRYVEITGPDAPPRPEAVEAQVIHNPLPRTGEFASSDPRLNRLFENIIWGQRGNYLEVPTDCPQRDERLGWAGDTQFFVRTAAYNFEIAPFLERWLTTLITDGQRPDGTLPSIAPAIDDSVWPSTGWGDAAILCAHALWQVYGDTRIIERHFAALERYIAFLDRGATAGIAKVGGFGDWLDKGGAAPAPVIDTAYYAHLCQLMSDMARAIGREQETARYASKAAEIRAAFQREFILPDGRIKDSGQTGYALAFTMGLVPEPARAAMTARFVESIEAHDWHLTTGFIGTPRLLPALHAAGRDDVAYRLLLQDTYPSWLYQVKLGATTMWERWDGWTPENGFQDRTMNSFNHYAFGAVGEYLYRHVAGIDLARPGFQEIAVRPRPGAGLTQARASYEAITGRIASAWSLHGKMFTLDVVIPPNTTASIELPAGASAVREGGQPVANSRDVETETEDHSSPRYRVGSGTYRFEATLP
jgi:alpha-L-rhamnosidase